MRDLHIDEDWDVPTEFDEDDKEQLLLEFIENCPYDTSDIPDDVFNSRIMQGIDEHLDYYTHTNGKIYVDDWDVFDLDLKVRLTDIVKELLGENE